jgi:uncharacterized protein (DUF305 family)
MSIRILILATAATTSLACSAAAQQNQQQAPGRGPIPMATDSLPEECRTAAQAGGTGQSMHRMDMQGAAQETQGMTANMSEAQKGYLQSMMKMRGPMQMGIMAKDPDVGFICGMIPHHQGAIDMAEVVLKAGHNPEARRFAERVISEQGREIAEMKDWLKRYAKKEGH